MAAVGKSTGPLSTMQVVEEAVRLHGKGPKGCSIIAIKKHINETYSENADGFLKQLKDTIDKGMETGALKRPEGHEDQHGLIGSVLLGVARNAKPVSVSNRALSASNRMNTVTSVAANTSKGQKISTKSVSKLDPEVTTPKANTNTKATKKVPVSKQTTPAAVKKAQQQTTSTPLTAASKRQETPTVNDQTFTQAHSSLKKTQSSGKRLAKNKSSNRISFASPLMSLSSPNLAAVIKEDMDGKKNSKLAVNASPAKPGASKNATSKANKAMPSKAMTASGLAPMRRSMSVPTINIVSAANDGPSRALYKNVSTYSHESLLSVSLRVSDSPDDYSDTENVAPKKQQKAATRNSKTTVKKSASAATKKTVVKATAASAKASTLIIATTSKAPAAAAKKKTGKTAATRIPREGTVPEASPEDPSAKRFSAHDPLYGYPSISSVDVAAKPATKLKAATRRT